MAHRRSFTRGISQSQRRKKTWIQLKQLAPSGGEIPGFITTFQSFIPATGPSGNGARAGFIFVTGDGTAEFPLVSNFPEECTILRIRGSLLFPKYITSEPLGTTDVATSFGFGVAAITDLDAQSYPAPGSNADWDGWMFKRQSPVSPVDSAGTIVDVKAMRKIKSGDCFFTMAESVALGTTSTDAQWQYDMRLLILLP